MKKVFFTYKQGRYPHLTAYPATQLRADIINTSTVEVQVKTTVLLNNDNSPSPRPHQKPTARRTGRQCSLTLSPFLTSLASSLASLASSMMEPLWERPREEAREPVKLLVRDRSLLPPAA